MLATITIVLIAALLALVFHFASSFGRQSEPVDLDEVLGDHYIEDRYRPMARLLRETDLSFLALQPSYSPAKLNQIRVQRRQLLRGYLSSLNADFTAVSFLVKSLMVESPVDRPELGRVLFQARASFLWSLALVHLGLTAQSIGLPGFAVEISRLTAALGEISKCALTLQTEPSRLPS